MFNIEDELKKLPSQPGVYLMHDAKDEIIYVGKAVSLKNRVRQYFQSSRNKSAKIEQMVSRIARFEYIVTDSEMEALVLECNLIKEHQPRYNTMLKDDKAYPYIKVTVGEDFPRVMLARTMKKDKNRYFGPYTSAGAVKDTIDLIHKLYKIRTCKMCIRDRIKACLNRKNVGEEIKVALDKENTNQAYLCGRLFAILERLQQEASNYSLNRTVKDAYFASASTRPLLVFPKLINLAIQSYLKKAQYPMFYNKLIGEVMVKLNGGFPDHFSLKEQGEFIVGYYQQNQAFYEKKNQEDREDERYGTGK